MTLLDFFVFFNWLGFIFPQMKILLLDRVHELFHQQFLKWNWVVVEGFNWTRSEFVDQIHLFDGIAVRSKFILDALVYLKQQI